MHAPANVININEDIMDKLEDKKVSRIDDAEYKKLYNLPKIDTKEYI